MVIILFSFLKLRLYVFRGSTLTLRSELRQRFSDSFCRKLAIASVICSFQQSLCVPLRLLPSIEIRVGRSAARLSDRCVLVADKEVHELKMLLRISHVQEVHTLLVVEDVHLIGLCQQEVRKLSVIVESSVMKRGVASCILSVRGRPHVLLIAQIQEQRVQIWIIIFDEQVDETATTAINSAHRSL